MKVLSIQSKEVLKEVLEKGICYPDITKASQRLVKLEVFKDLVEAYNWKCKMPDQKNVDNVFWGFSYIETENENKDMKLENIEAIKRAMEMLFIDESEINEGKYVIMELDIPDENILETDFYDYCSMIVDCEERSYVRNEKFLFWKKGDNRDSQVIFDCIKSEWLLRYADNISISKYDTMSNLIFMLKGSISVISHNLSKQNHLRLYKAIRNTLNACDEFSSKAYELFGENALSDDEFVLIYSKQRKIKNLVLDIKNKVENIGHLVIDDPRIISVYKTIDKANKTIDALSEIFESIHDKCSNVYLGYISIRQPDVLMKHKENRLVEYEVSSLDGMHKKFMNELDRYTPDDDGSIKIVLRVYDSIDFTFDYNINDETYLIDYYILDHDYNRSVAEKPDFKICKNRLNDKITNIMVANLIKFISAENLLPESKWTKFKSIKTISKINRSVYEPVLSPLSDLCEDDNSVKSLAYVIGHSFITNNEFDCKANEMFFQNSSGVVYVYLGIDKDHKLHFREFDNGDSKFDFHDYQIVLIPMTEDEMKNYPFFCNELS